MNEGLFNEVISWTSYPKSSAAGEKKDQNRSINTWTACEWWKFYEDLLGVSFITAKYKYNINR